LPQCDPLPKALRRRRIRLAPGSIGRRRRRDPLPDFGPSQL